MAGSQDEVQTLISRPPDTPARARMVAPSCLAEPLVVYVSQLPSVSSFSLLALAGWSIMDQGHYNCRDYYITPHFAPTTIANERPSLPRHESFQELEERSRSPASQRPKFPLLKLPFELRQQILGYILPHTHEFRDTGLLSDHVRNFSAVKKREAKGMVLPRRNAVNQAASISNVVWKRGNIDILRVCKQLHHECTEMIYGWNTFLLFVTYSGIVFRYRWLLPSGLAPSRSFNLLKTMPRRYLRLMRKLVIHVDHVDPYTGMIKFNVQGKGLTAGLKSQLEQLVDAIRSRRDADGDFDMTRGVRERKLAKVNIRVSNGNSVVDALKPSEIRLNCEAEKTNQDLEDMLSPFGSLRGVGQVHISGAVPEDLAERLTQKMKSVLAPGESDDYLLLEKKLAKEKLPPPALCVYGNDME